MLVHSFFLGGVILVSFYIESIMWAAHSHFRIVLIESRHRLLFLFLIELFSVDRQVHQEIGMVDWVMHILRVLHACFAL